MVRMIVQINLMRQIVKIYGHLTDLVYLDVKINKWCRQLEQIYVIVIVIVSFVMISRTIWNHFAVLRTAHNAAAGRDV